MSVGFRRGRPERFPGVWSGGGGSVLRINIFPSPPILAEQGTGSVSGVTCTRVGIRSCVKSDGTLVKLTTNQVAVEPNGILVERGVTNLLIYSEEFENVAWDRLGDVLNPTLAPNVVAAPDGTSTADTLEHGQNVTTGLGSYSIIRPTTGTTVSIGTTYMVSLWLKNGTATADPKLFINDSGVITSTLCALSSAWQRFFVSATATTTTAFGSVGYGNQVANVIGQSFHLWGSQLIARDYAGAYVPTTSASASSADDVVTIANPLSGMSIAFTFAASFTPTYARTWQSRTGIIALWQLGTAGSNNSIAVSRNASNRVVVVLQDGAGGTKTYTSASSLIGATTKRISYAHEPVTGGVLYIDGALDAGSWAGVGTGIVTQGASYTLGRHASTASTMLDGHVYNIVMTTP